MELTDWQSPARTTCNIPLKLTSSHIESSVMKDFNSGANNSYSIQILVLLLTSITGELYSAISIFMIPNISW